MSKIVVLGGHGQIALHLLKLLAESGHEPVGIVRNPDHTSDLEAIGATAVVADVEQGDDLEQHVRGADAVVFAAGAGPGSGPQRKRTVDLGAAVALIEACKAAGVRRYVQVSSIGAEDPSQGEGDMVPYLEAKHEADEALKASGLDYTIVRPGRLTDDGFTGKVALGPDLPRGDITREDVAGVIAAVLERPATIGTVFVAVEGEDSISQALEAL